jgi:hypothetical protein
MVLYKNPLLLHEKVGFEAFAICYPNKDHINFLEEKGLRVIVWPHSLDFTLSKESFSKKYMWISAGQQHEEYYPSRWNLTQILYHQFKENGFILPHPGYDVDNLGHPYVGEKFLELLDDFIFIPIGIGINDGLHMKFVEAAYSNMLPIGTVPSYIPDHIKDLIPFSRMDPLNYDVGLIINTLNDLASTSQELVRRVLAYKEYFKQNYDSKIVLDRVAEEIIE